jgi:hypothetical protein
VRIVDVETTDTEKGGRLCARVLWDRRDFESDHIYYVYRDTPAAAITHPGDTLLASMFVPAMAMGEDVHVDAPVSVRLAEGTSKIASTIKGWYPKFRQSQVSAPAAQPPSNRPRAVASFFSGGIDSFHTILRPRAERIDLVFTIIGFDMRFEKRAAAPIVLPRLERAAEALGLQMMVVDSNAYEVGHKYLFNAEHHGGFLASIALALGSTVGRCFIPSSWSERNTRPWGSHPETDPLWSTETLEFVHDGFEVRRRAKAAVVSANPVALEHLRVCVRRPELYNCRRCPKCVATTLLLHIAGTLDQCATLGPLDPRLVRRTPMLASYHVSAAAYAFENEAEPQLRAALRRALFLGRLLRALDPLIDIVRRRRLRRRLRLLRRQDDPR